MYTRMCNFFVVYKYTEMYKINYQCFDRRRMNTSNREYHQIDQSKIRCSISPGCALNLARVHRADRRASLPYGTVPSHVIESTAMTFSLGRARDVGY